MSVKRTARASGPPAPEARAALEPTAVLLGQLLARRYGYPTSDARVEFDGTRLRVTFVAALAPYERELAAEGRGRLAPDARVAFQEAMAPVFKAVVEEGTGRRVLSQTASCLYAEQRCRLLFVLAPGGR